MTLAQLEAEMGLARKIQSLTTIDAFAGDTTVEHRKAYVRSVIRNAGMEGVVFAVKDGKHISMAQQFQKAYLESL